MNFYLQCLIDFVGIFLIVYIIYSVFINKRRKELNMLKNSSEVKAVIIRYNLNMNKIKYKNLLNAIAIINSFIIAFTVVIVVNIESLLWAILSGFVTLIILIYSLYEILGLYYRKKGKTNE